MTFPVFASGDVLNASDMNAVGMWLVKTQTIGTAVSSVQVTSAFSTNYRNYLILLDGGVGSTSSDIVLTLGSASTAYYSSLFYNTYSSGTLIGFNFSNTANFPYVGQATTNKIIVAAKLFGPFETNRTSMSSRVVQTTTTGLSGIAGGFLNDATSYTSFTLTPSSGTLTGGVIRVYGFQN